MKECNVCCRCYPDEVNHCPGDGEVLKQTLRGETVLDGRYQLESRLGQGGMGIVYKARHIFLKTQHAIKVILPDLVGNDPSLTTRFRQEAMAAAAIQHQNTVGVTDYGIINDTVPFLVMEFVEGRSLHDILQLEGKLPPARALEIMLAVCAGVGAAHEEEIVHRDLKPLNILLKNGAAPEHGVKVLDFGLAKIKSGELLGSFVAAQTQGMMGSPFYMAPEQWGDEDVDRRADIYSLGVILYQMLAGEVPFKGNSVPSIMNKHLTTRPMPLHERGVFVPPELERAVLHALEKEASARPQNVKEFIAELEEAAAAVSAAAAAARQSGVIGMQTVQIPPSDTMSEALDKETGANERAKAREPDAGAGSGNLVSPGAVADAQAGLQTGVVEEEPSSPVVNPVVPSRGTTPLIDTPPPDGMPGRGAETAGQRGDATDYQQDLVDDESAKTNRDEAPTALLDTAEESRLRAEIERQAEEAREREAEEAARRREAEEARVREEEEQRRREEDERRRRHEENERAAASASGAVVSQPPPVGEDVGAHVTTPEPPRSRMLLIVAGGVAALILLGGAVLAYFVVPQIIASLRNANTNVNASANTNANGDANTNTNANTSASPTPELFKPDLVSLPGGTYRMGRAEVPPVSPQLNRGYLLWLYSQWPAHEVSVGAFSIDRTEVTNAEYASFIRETGHPAPPGWDGNQPKAGDGSLPVNNVSYEDAQRFAAWRSRRDSVTYRLPTEAEWEYAARGGGVVRAYPWGDEWATGRANLNSDAPQPVGSFPDGRTEQGADDLIGNVWEWTSSTAAMYEGNDRTRLADGDRGKLVVRGGAYASTHAGNEPVTVTSRRWVERDLRDPVLGFRLVRVAP